MRKYPLSRCQWSIRISVTSCRGFRPSLAKARYYTFRHYNSKNYGSSHSYLDGGGAGVLFIAPDGAEKSYSFPVGKIASNYTCELSAIASALEIYLSKAVHRSNGIVVFSDCRSALEAIRRGSCQLSHKIIKLINKIVAAKKSCTLQWVPAHVDILGNEKADQLAKEARKLTQLSTSLTLVDANAIANRRFINQQIKKNSITELNCNRTLSTIVTRLRTKHLKGMKISAEGERSYANLCHHCPDNTQLSPQHIFDCPSMQAKLFKISLDHPSKVFHSEKAVEIAEAVFDSFGMI